MIGEPNAKPSAQRHGVDGIAHQVIQKLPHLSGKAKQVRFRPVVPNEIDIQAIHAAQVERDNRIQQIRHRDMTGNVDCR